MIIDMMGCSLGGKDYFTERFSPVNPMYALSPRPPYGCARSHLFFAKRSLSSEVLP